MSTNNILAELLMDVLETQESKVLDRDKQDRFHVEFETEISGTMEEMRADQRRAYENTKDIAFS